MNAFVRIFNMIPLYFAVACTMMIVWAQRLTEKNIVVDIPEIHLDESNEKMKIIRQRSAIPGMGVVL